MPLGAAEREGGRHLLSGDHRGRSGKKVSNGLLIHFYKNRTFFMEVGVFFRTHVLPSSLTVTPFL